MNPANLPGLELLALFASLGVPGAGIGLAMSPPAIAIRPEPLFPLRGIQ
jgi:hypothetical protein